MKNEYLSAKETAKRIGKHENTIRNMISDGRIKASKTSNGEYQISPEDVYLFEKEKEVKENNKKVETSVDVITWNIENEILHRSDELYKRICDSIILFQNSDEFKERKKLVKILNGKNVGDEKKENAYNRLKEINYSLNTMQQEILQMLRYDLEEFFKLDDLKYDIQRFGNIAIARDMQRLERIENMWEERW